jgi:DNA primase
MFPLNNHRGQVLGFAGRILPGTETPMGKYINTPETEIYHKSDILYALDLTRSEIKSAKFAVIVEGEIDAIASFQAGVKNVVAIKGSALTARQIELLRRICDTAILALDSDIAGDAAARRGIEIAEKSGLSIKMAVWSGSKDPGDLAIQNPEEWKTIIDQALPIYDFYLQSAVQRFGLEIGGKKKVSQELLPLIGKIDDEIVKAHYIKKLAQTLGVDEADVRNQLGKTPAQNQSETTNLKSQIPSQSLPSRQEMIERYVVGLAIRENKLAELFKSEGLIHTPFWKKVLESLKANPDVKTLPSELKDQVQDVYLTETEFDAKEWDKSLKRLEEIDIRGQITQLKGDDPQLVRKLSHRLADLTREL